MFNYHGGQGQDRKEAQRNKNQNPGEAPEVPSRQLKPGAFVSRQIDRFETKIQTHKDGGSSYPELPLQYPKQPNPCMDYQDQGIGILPKKNNLYPNIEQQSQTQNQPFVAPPPGLQHPALIPSYADQHQSTPPTFSQHETQQNVRPPPGYPAQFQHQWPYPHPYQQLQRPPLDTAAYHYQEYLMQQNFVESNQSQPYAYDMQNQKTKEQISYGQYQAPQGTYPPQSYYDHSTMQLIQANQPPLCFATPQLQQVDDKQQYQQRYQVYYTHHPSGSIPGQTEQLHYHNQSYSETNIGQCAVDTKETGSMAAEKKIEEKSTTKVLIGAGTTNENTEYHSEGVTNVENVRDKGRMTSSEGSVQSTFDQNQAPDSNAHCASQATASSLPQDQEREEQEDDDKNFIDCMYKFKDEVNTIKEWTTYNQKAESRDFGSTIDYTEEMLAEAPEFEEECDKKLRILNEEWGKFQQVCKKIQSSKSEVDKFVVTTKDYKSKTGIIPEGEVMQLVDKKPNQWCSVIRRNGNRQYAPSSHLRDFDLSEGMNECEGMYMMLHQILQSLIGNIQKKCQQLEDKKKHDILVVQTKELTDLMERVNGKLEKEAFDQKLREMGKIAQQLESTQYQTDACRMYEDITKRWKECKVDQKHTFNDRQLDDSKYSEDMDKKNGIENKDSGKKVQYPKRRTEGNIDLSCKLILHDGWSDLMIKIKAEDKETKMKSKALGLPWFLVQYAILMEKQNVAGFFESEQMTLRYKPEKMTLECSGKHDFSTMEQVFKDTFNNIVLHNLCYCMLNNTEERKEMMFEGKLNLDCVAAYKDQSTSAVYVVGEIQSLQKMFPGLKINHWTTEDDNVSESIHHTLEDYYLFKNIDFMAKLQKMNIDVKIEPKQTVGIKKHLRQYQQELDIFRSRIHEETIPFTDSVCQYLLFPEGHLDERVYKHFQKLLKLQTSFHIQRKDNVTIVLSEDSKVCKKAAKYIADSVVHFRGIVEENKLKPLLSDHRYNFKIKVLKESSSVELVCFQEVLKLFTYEQKQQESFPLTTFLLQYFQKKGIGCLKAMADKYSVCIQIQGASLDVSGNPSDIKSYKKCVKEWLSSIQKCLPVDVDYSVIKECQSSIDDVTENAGCIWRVGSSSNLFNCTYIATWAHPLNNSNITLLNGDSTEIDFDVLVVMTNSSLYPFQQKSSVMRKGGERMLSEGKRYIEKIGKNANLGYIHNGHGYEFIKSKEICSIVVKTHCGKEIEPHTLKESIEDVLKRKYKKPIKIGMEIFTDGFQMIDEVLRTTIEAVLKHFITFPESRVKFYIVSDEELETKLSNIIGKLLTGQQGYTMKRYSIPIEVTNIDVVCQTGSIHTSKVDVIVNPCSKELDLKKGAVSKLILQHAGLEIQNQCKELYPKGINYGEIAITDSCKLKDQGCKLVFHCASPEYDRNNYTETVRQLVRKCLYTAEERLCQSIAFPALCVGQLKYPRRDVVAAMFDVIDEYRKECLNPRLQQIRIVLYEGDNETKNAFFQEEWRKSQQFSRHLLPSTEQGFRAVKKKKSTLSSVSEYFLGKPDVTDIIIINEDDVAKRPSSAVKAVFTKANSKERCTIHYASEVKPFSWHDNIKFQVDKSKTFEENLQQLFAYFEGDRVTEMIISPTEEFKESPEMQIEIIAKMSEEFLKHKERGQYLRTVCIVVKDEIMLDKILNMLNGKLWSSPWVKVEEKVNKDDLYIRIAGDSDQINKVSEEIQKIISHTRESYTDLGIQAKQSNIGATQNYTSPMNTKHAPGQGAQVLMNKPLAPESGAMAAVSVQLAPGQGAQGTKKKFQVANTTVTYSEIGSKKIHESQGAIPKHTNYDIPPYNTNINTDDNNYVDEGFIQYNQIFGPVSATLNSGIIEFKEDMNDLDRWVVIVKEHFDLNQLKKDDSGDVTFEGSFDAIHRLQAYLDNEFPLDPCQLLSPKEHQTKDICFTEDFISMEEFEYLSLLKFFPDKMSRQSGFRKMTYVKNENKMTFQMNSAVQPFKSQIEKCIKSLGKVKQNNSYEDYLLIKELVSEEEEKYLLVYYDYKDNATVIIGLQKETTYTNFIHQYSKRVKMAKNETFGKNLVFNGKRVSLDLGKTVVEVQEGNLKNEMIDCIVVSSNSNMSNQYGVALSVASAAGNRYREACKESVAVKGQLKRNECRVTTSGNLKGCQAIAHILIPVFTDNNKSVDELKDATLNCFKEVSSYGIQSIALPFIGSGGNGFPFKQCAKAFTGALYQFNSQNKTRTCSLSRIVFVDQNKDCLETLWSELCQTFDEGEMKPIGENTNDDCISGKEWCFKGCKLYFRNGYVKHIDTGAIVCSNNETLCVEGTVFNQLYGNTTVKQLIGQSSMQNKSLVCIDSPKGCKARFVILSIVPERKKNYFSPEEVNQRICAIIKRCSELGFKSIALPLQGFIDLRESICDSQCFDGLLSGLEKSLQEYKLSVYLCLPYQSMSVDLQRTLKGRNNWFEIAMETRV